MRYTRNNLLYQFVQILYSRTEVEFTRGTFRVKGDTVDVFPAYADFAYPPLLLRRRNRERCTRIDPVSGKKLSDEQRRGAVPGQPLRDRQRHACTRPSSEIQYDMVAAARLLREGGPRPAKPSASWSAPSSTWR